MVKKNDKAETAKEKDKEDREAERIEAVTLINNTKTNPQLNKLCTAFEIMTQRNLNALNQIEKRNLTSERSALEAQFKEDFPMKANMHVIQPVYEYEDRL